MHIVFFIVSRPPKSSLYISVGKVVVAIAWFLLRSGIVTSYKFIQRAANQFRCYPHDENENKYTNRPEPRHVHRCETLCTLI